MTLMLTLENARRSILAHLSQQPDGIVTGKALAQHLIDVGYGQGTHSGANETSSTLRLGAYGLISTLLDGQKDQLGLVRDELAEFVTTRNGWRITDKGRNTLLKVTPTHRGRHA